MAIGTPFHDRTSVLCHSHDWRNWAGYVVASSYDDFVQPEYAAIRDSAALIDISPLYKYEVGGPDAAALLDRVVTQDVAAMPVGRVVYTPWCDTNGKVRQEGTLFHLKEETFVLCAAEPCYAWLLDNGRGLNAAVTDRTTELAALSLQGPLSRQILEGVSTASVADLKFFHSCNGEIEGFPVTITRTGYTGDLGYEIWAPQERALALWDALMAEGSAFNIRPCGLQAMDVARVEAGFVLIGVDYVSSEHALLDHHAVDPFELGLGWAVKLDKERPCVGHRALRAAEAAGLKRQVVGLEIDWRPLERSYLDAGLMPDLPLTPCREAVPVYSGARQVGRVTTRVWSQLLKKYIGIATLEATFSSPGSEVEMEITVDYERKRAPARVVHGAFFRPSRARA